MSGFGQTRPFGDVGSMSCRKRTRLTIYEYKPHPPNRGAYPSHASSAGLLRGHRLKQRIELLDHRRAEMALRVRRWHAVHHFPAANENARVIERTPEIRS